MQIVAHSCYNINGDNNVFHKGEVMKNALMVIVLAILVGCAGGSSSPTSSIVSTDISVSSSSNITIKDQTIDFGNITWIYAYPFIVTGGPFTSITSNDSQFNNIVPDANGAFELKIDNSKYPAGAWTGSTITFTNAAKSVTYNLTGYNELTSFTVVDNNGTDVLTSNLGVIGSANNPPYNLPAPTVDNCCRVMSYNSPAKDVISRIESVTITNTGNCNITVYNVDILYWGEDGYLKDYPLLPNQSVTIVFDYNGVQVDELFNVVGQATMNSNMPLLKDQYNSYQYSYFVYYWHD